MLRHKPSIIVSAISAVIAFGLLSDTSPARISPPDISVDARPMTSANTIAGIVKNTAADRISVDVQGITTTVLVPTSCDISKDRRPAELEALIPRDRVLIEVAGSGESPVATEIAAFSVN